MIRMLLSLFCLLLGLPASATAEGWTAETLPMVHLTDARRYVCNPDGVLSQAAVDSTDLLLARLERDKGIETVVAVVRRVEGGDPYEFGMALARKYGIGDKEQRTGLIVILSTEDRAYQILTGNGLEGTLPDALCRRIQNRVMVPLLKRGDWDGAVLKTMQAIDSVARGDSSLAPKASSGDGDGRGMGLFIALFLVVAVFLLSTWMGGKRTARCPRCHRYLLAPVKTRRYRDSAGRWKVQTTYRCSHCGHTEIRDSEVPPPGMGGGLFVPPVIMGGGRGLGGFGGGGFSGGSFGGGSFGGGGSGGRF